MHASMFNNFSRRKENLIFQKFVLIGISICEQKNSNKSSTLMILKHWNKVLYVLIENFSQKIQKYNIHSSIISITKNISKRSPAWTLHVPNSPNSFKTIIQCVLKPVMKSIQMGLAESYWLNQTWTKIL